MIAALLQFWHRYLTFTVEIDFPRFASHALSLDQVLLWDPFVPFGYPFLLWAFTRTGISVLAAGKILAGLSAILCLGLVYPLARLFLPRRESVLAQILCAVNWHFAQYGILCGTDLPWVAVQLASFIILLRALTLPGLTLAFLAGAVAGLAFDLRYHTLIALPWMALCLALADFRAGTRGRALLRVLLLALGFFLAASPQLAINLTQQHALFATGQVKNVWMGMHGQGNWAEHWAEAGQYQTLLGLIQADPIRFFSHWAKEAVIFSLRLPPLVLGIQPALLTLEPGPHLRIFFLAGLGLLGLTFLLGLAWKPWPLKWPSSFFPIFRGVPDLRRAFALFLFGYLFLYGAAISMAFTQFRFLLPLVPFGAVALAGLIHHLQPSQSYRRWIAPFSLALVMTMLCAWGFYVTLERFQSRVQEVESALAKQPPEPVIEQVKADLNPAAPIINTGSWKRAIPSWAWSGVSFGLAYSIWDNNSWPGHGVWFVRLDPEGHPFGEVTQLTDAKADSPCVVWNGAEWAVFWYEAVGNNTHIFFRKVTAAGVPLGKKVQVTTDETPPNVLFKRPPRIFFHTMPLAVWDSKRSIYGLVYFHGSGFGSGGTPVFSRVDSAGAMIGAEVIFSSVQGLWANILGLDLNPGNGQFGVAYYNRAVNPYQTYFALLDGDDSIAVKDVALSPGHDCQVFWNGSGWDFFSIGVGQVYGEIFLTPISAAGKPGKPVRVTHLGLDHTDVGGYSISYSPTLRGYLAALVGLKGSVMQLWNFAFDATGREVFAPVVLDHFHEAARPLIHGNSQPLLLYAKRPAGVADFGIYTRAGSWMAPKAIASGPKAANPASTEAEAMAEPGNKSTTAGQAGVQSEIKILSNRTELYSFHLPYSWIKLPVEVQTPDQLKSFAFSSGINYLLFEEGHGRSKEPENWPELKKWAFQQEALYLREEYPALILMKLHGD